MRSINQKEEELKKLEALVMAVNNQIDKLEDQSLELSSKIILVKRQLDLIIAQEEAHVQAAIRN